MPTPETIKAAINTHGLRLEWREADSLEDNPANWKRHPDRQLDALTGALDEVGWAGALLYNETTGRLIDGHGRKNINRGKVVPVLVGAWTPEQERVILQTLDPLGSLAEPDLDKMNEAFADLERIENDSLAAVAGDFAERHGVGGSDDDEPTKLKQISTLPPPKMTWALIGIPTVRFGEIAELMERLAVVPGIFLETTSNDVEANR